MKKIVYAIGSVMVALGFIALWAFVAHFRFVSPIFLPGPDRAWAVLQAASGSSIFWERIVETLQRMALGWLLASLLGVFVGGAIGLSQTARVYLGGILEFMRPIPASAVIPAGILIFGLTEQMVLAVIAFGAVWPTLLATTHGFVSVSPRLREVSVMLRLSLGQYIVKIALPSSLPEIFAGARLSLTISLILTIVAEMVAGRTGVGSWIMLSARAFRSPDVFAGVILFGLIGAGSGLLLTLIEARLLRWRKTY
jgi:ABC-type nitrate/sulfonate/bicarbonate transport system permease component